MITEIDIHGCSIWQAKQIIDDVLNKAPKEMMEVRVIHGYRGGNSLQAFMRKQYQHKRCTRKIVTLNAGETILIIKRV